jgi:hypothetical protein
VKAIRTDTQRGDHVTADAKSRKWRGDVNPALT